MSDMTEREREREKRIGRVSQYHDLAVLAVFAEADHNSFHIV